MQRGNDVSSNVYAKTKRRLTCASSIISSLATITSRDDDYDVIGRRKKKRKEREREKSSSNPASRTKRRGERRGKEDEDEAAALEGLGQDTLPSLKGGRHFSRRARWLSCVFCSGGVVAA